MTTTKPCCKTQCGDAWNTKTCATCSCHQQATATPESKECEHNFDDLYHPGRATWICKMCGDDVSLLYVLMQDALRGQSNDFRTGGSMVEIVPEHSLDFSEQEGKCCNRCKEYSTRAGTGYVGRRCEGTCDCHAPESKCDTCRILGIEQSFGCSHVPAPESVPAQDWEKAFDAEIKDTPLASSAFGKGMVKDFIRQQIAAAREEGRHQGLIKAGNLVAYFIDHTKKQQPGRVMYMQGVEEGRRAMREETLAILVTEIAQAHKDGTPTARLTSAYNTITSK